MTAAKATNTHRFRSGVMLPDGEVVELDEREDREIALDGLNDKTSFLSRRSARKLWRRWKRTGMVPQPMIWVINGEDVYAYMLAKSAPRGSA